MEFEWDETKRRKVLEDHGVDFAKAALIFEGRVVTEPDLRRDYGEKRFVSLGMVDGRCCVVVHTDRNGVTRLISAWYGGRREYGHYQAGLARRNSPNV